MHLSAWARLKMVTEVSICTIPSRPRRSLHSAHPSRSEEGVFSPEENFLWQTINDIKRTHAAQVALSEGETKLK